MNEEFIKRLREQRVNIRKQQEELFDKAVEEKRDLSAEEKQTEERLNADLDAIAQRVADLEEGEQRSKDANEALERLMKRRQEHKPDEREQAKSEAEELRAFARGEKGREIVFMPTGEARDLIKSTGDTPKAGNTVPTSFYDRLVEHMIEVSGILQAGPTILNTASGENLEIPTTTSHATAALTAEANAISESEPVFAKRTLGAYKYATAIQVSRELATDTGVDLLGYLARAAGRAVGNALGTDLAVGNASSKPSGLMQTTTAGVTGGTSVSGAFTADNLIDLYYSVISPYRNSPSCSWVMRDATVAAVRKLKGSDNNYLWQPGLQVGAPDLLLGKPVHTDPNIAAVATSAKSVAFGDISAYFVRLAGGVRFERSDEFAFTSDLITFKCVVRGDGILVDQTGAVKHFVGGAS